VIGLRARERTPLAEKGILARVVVQRFTGVLRLRLDAIKQWHGLLKQQPSESQCAPVNIFHFIHLRVGRESDLRDDRAVVDPGSNLMNGDAMLPLSILKRPVDRRDAAIAGQRAVVQIQNAPAAVDKIPPDNAVVINGKS